MRRQATAVILLLVAGCGSTGEPSDGSAEGPRIDLTVEVSEGEGAPERTWELTCDPEGGSHPDAAAACDTLLELGREQAVGPVPADMQCTQIYGGPQVARVTGTWDGEQVDARFDRTDGCQISRWDALQPLLPAGGASTPAG